MDKPTLQGAKHRTVRAVQRHAELAGLVAELETRNKAEPIVVRVDRQTLERGEELSVELDWSRVKAAYSPVEAKMLAGEVIYHLRTALEYVAYSLAWLDSGVIQERTQFPIRDKRSEWNEACRRDLPGVNGAHREGLRKVQPFEGVEWTRTLRDLSNADKHRLLTDVAREHALTFQADRESALIDPDDPTKMRIPVRGWTTGLILPDGSEVLGTLAALIKEVAALLATFQADFGETDTLTIADQP